MFALGVLTIVLIIRSNRRFRKRNKEENGDAMFSAILSTDDQKEAWNILLVYIFDQQHKFLTYANESYQAITKAFISENSKVLSKAEASLIQRKNILKNARRKETLCLRHVDRKTAIEKSTWFHLSNNCCMGILYNLRGITEVSKEHVENNFLPLPQQYKEDYELIRTRVSTLFNDTLDLMETGAEETVPVLRRHCDEIKDTISDTYHRLHDQLREGDTASMTVVYVYLNMLQETQEMVSSIRKYLRAIAKLRDSDFRSRQTSRQPSMS